MARAQTILLQTAFVCFIFVAVELTFVLCVVLIPRPVPCDRYPTTISTVLLDSVDPLDPTIEYQLPFIFFPSANPGTSQTLRMQGSFFNSPPENATFFLNDSIPLLYDVNISSDCFELNLNLNPGHFVCESAINYVPWMENQKPGNATQYLIYLVQNGDVCNNTYAVTAVPAIFGDSVNMTITSLEPNTLCQVPVSGAATSVLITGEFFFFVNNSVTEEPEDPFIWYSVPPWKQPLILQPYVFWNNSLVASSIVESSCEEIFEGEVEEHGQYSLKQCTEIEISIPTILDTALPFTTNQIKIYNPSPILTSVVLDNAFNITNCTGR